MEMLEFEVPLEVGDSDRRSFEISVSDHDFRGKEATKPISKDEIERLRTRPMKESAKDGGER